MTLCLEPSAVRSRVRTDSRRTPDQLRRLAEIGARRLADAPAAEVLAWAAGTFGTRLAVTSSMTDSVVAHLASVARPGVDVLFLETGYHFPQTLRTRDAVAARLPVRVLDIQPLQTVAQQDAAHGPDLFARDPGRCCALRKVDPLRTALAPYEAWISGIRRADGLSRRHAQTVEWDPGRGMVKINPIVAWSDADVSSYAAQHDLPVNPLVDAGFPSIGCWPCTTAAPAGDHARAGRWAGSAKTECGLHT